MRKGIMVVLDKMKNARFRKIFWTCMVFLVMAVIFYFSSQGIVKSEETSDILAEFLGVKQLEENTRVSNQSVFLGFSVRKPAHVSIFAVLAFCMFQALEDRKKRSVLTVVFSYLYAVFDEVHQIMIGRHGRWQDTMIDLLGIALGLAGALALPFLFRVVEHILRRQSV